MSDSEQTVPKEKRTDGRTHVTGPVRARIESLDFEGPSVDVSERGVYFLLPPNSPVKLTLEIDGQRHERQGRVIRVDPVAERIYGVAIAFTEGSPGAAPPAEEDPEAVTRPSGVEGGPSVRPGDPGSPA